MKLKRVKKLSYKVKKSPEYPVRIFTDKEVEKFFKRDKKESKVLKKLGYI